MATLVPYGYREPTRSHHLVCQASEKYLHGILASAIYRMNSSISEGVDNKIKVIKRVAYGFRDSAYFFLEIKAAFLSKAR